jgi:hypothetical protein
VSGLKKLRHLPESIFAKRVGKPEEMVIEDDNSTLSHYLAYLHFFSVAALFKITPISLWDILTSVAISLYYYPGGKARELIFLFSCDHNTLA